jgi:hypothetical protein
LNIELQRSSSLSPSRRDLGFPRGREMSQARSMAQSMPNLHTNRSMHNRSVGYSLLSHASECGDRREAKGSRARVQDFDALLEGL